MNKVLSHAMWATTLTAGVSIIGVHGAAPASAAPHDVDGDGYNETLSVDTNGDGKADELQIDTDKTGAVDITLGDYDNNGTLNYFRYDINNDGSLELMGWDHDGNGVADMYYQGAPGNLVAVDTNEDGVLEPVPTPQPRPIDPQVLDTLNYVHETQQRSIRAWLE